MKFIIKKTIVQFCALRVREKPSAILTPSLQKLDFFLSDWQITIPKAELFNSQRSDYQKFD
jgi:hypothetical protein